MSTSRDSAIHLIISHGQESGPGSTKMQALAERAAELGFACTLPDYGTTAPASVRIEQLCTVAKAQQGAVALIGSSMGAYISGMASLQVPVLGLFLLAPPVFFAGLEPALRVRAPVVQLMHGWRDELIEAGEVCAFARAYRAELLMVDDTHRLTQSIPRMLQAFEHFLRAISSVEVSLVGASNAP